MVAVKKPEKKLRQNRHWYKQGIIFFKNEIWNQPQNKMTTKTEIWKQPENGWTRFLTISVIRTQINKAFVYDIEKIWLYFYIIYIFNFVHLCSNTSKKIICKNVQDFKAIYLAAVCENLW